MKRLGTFLLFVGILGFCHGQDATGGQAAFDKIKALAGQWQGSGPGGDVNVSYEVVAGGSAVMERWSPADHPTMISMYHMDGANLLMTHYCSASNQPRMKAETPAEDGNVISFSLLDVTNLTSPTDGHMQALAITIKDKNHFLADWTFSQGGEKHKNPVELKRIEK